MLARSMPERIEVAAVQLPGRWNRWREPLLGAVAGLVGIECGVVSGVINLESSGVEASDWRLRHDEHYHEVAFLAA
jgi:hypothetical protein